MIDPESIDPEFEEPNEDNPELKRKRLLDSPVDCLEDQIIEFSAWLYWPDKGDDEDRYYADWLEWIEKYFRETCQRDYINNLIDVLGTFSPSEKQSFILKLRLQFVQLPAEKRKDIFNNKINSFIHSEWYKKTGGILYGLLYDYSEVYDLYNSHFESYKEAVIHLCDEVQKQLLYLQDNSINKNLFLTIYKDFTDLLKSYAHPNTCPLYWYRQCKESLVYTELTIQGNLQDLSWNDRRGYINDLKSALDKFLEPYRPSTSSNFKKWLNEYGLTESELFALSDNQNELYQMLSESTDSLSDWSNPKDWGKNAVQIHTDFYAYYFNQLYAIGWNFLNDLLKKSDKETVIKTFKFKKFHNPQNKITDLYHSLIEKKFIVETDLPRFKKVFKGDEFNPEDFPLIRWEKKGYLHTFMKWIEDKKELFPGFDEKQIWIMAATFFADKNGKKFDNKKLRGLHGTTRDDELTDLLDKSLL